jgi:hypothetical protein
MTISAKRQLMQSRKTTMPLSTEVPHETSSSAQPMMRDRFEQSLVMRAISQPTALRS